MSLYLIYIVGLLPNNLSSRTESFLSMTFSLLCLECLIIKLSKTLKGCIQQNEVLKCLSFQISLKPKIHQYGDEEFVHF